MFGAFINRNTSRNNNRNGNNSSSRSNSSSPQLNGPPSRNGNVPPNTPPNLNSSDDEVEMSNVYGRNINVDNNNSVFGNAGNERGPSIWGSNAPTNNPINEENAPPQLTPTGNRLVEFLATNNMNTNPDNNEQARRQRMLRIALMVTLIFFLLDSHISTTAVNNNNRSKANENPEIILPKQVNLLALKRTLAPLRKEDFYEHNMNQYNISGYYTGIWKTSAAWNSSSDNHVDQPIEFGHVFMQLSTVPIRNLPDMSFVYGTVKHYQHTGSLIYDLTYPAQGILLPALKKVYLLPTRYRSQELFVELTTNPVSSSASSSSSSPTRSPTTSLLSTTTAMQLEDVEDIVEDRNTPLLQDNVKKHAAFLDIPDTSYQQQQQQRLRHHHHHLLQRQRRQLLQDNNDDPLMPIPLPGSSTGSTGIGQITIPNLYFEDGNHTVSMRLYVQDMLLNPLYPNITITNTPTKGSDGTGNGGILVVKPQENTVIFSLGEHMLPARLKSIQLPRHIPAKDSTGQPTAAPTMAPSTNAMDGSSDGGNNDIIPKKKCKYYLELDLPSIVPSAVATTTEQVTTSPTDTRTPANTDKEVNKKPALTEFEGNIASSGIHPPENFMGTANGMGENECGKHPYSLSLTSYETQFSSLKTKVDIYSVVYIFLSFTQVMIVMYQMRMVVNTAQIAKQAMLTLLSQSMLDAIICMGHLLLATGIPQMFFTTFIWISFMKLSLFSIFQMRMVILVYQARNTQELSTLGWRGFRSRIVQLHLRFYGILFLILILAFSFQTKPLIAVIFLYSFWWPQILYSFYSNTKHSFTGVYLYGMTLTRLFLPLYFLGCPRNFLILLWQQFSPVMSTTFQPLDMEHPGDILLTPAVYQSSLEVIVFILVWVGIQMILLGCQSYFGPRGCIPKTWFPRGYDYHRPIPRSVILGQRSSGSSSSSSATSSSTTRSGTRRTLTWLEAFRARMRWIGRYMIGRSTSYHNGIQYSTVSTTENFLSPSSPEEDEDLYTTAAVAAETEAEEEGVRDYGDIETGSYLPSFLTTTPSSTAAQSIAGAGEAGGAVAAATAAGEGAGHEGHSGLDCVICYNQIYLNLRTPYMITPCDHVFHEECLKQWMAVKLECPVCRAVIPGVEEDEDGPSET